MRRAPRLADHYQLLEIWLVGDPEKGNYYFEIRLPNTGHNIALDWKDSAYAFPAAAILGARDWINRHYYRGVLQRNPITMLSPTEADQIINKRALPIFHGFRYRKGEVWYRQGRDDEFTEFTFCPAKMLGEMYCSPQMSGGRDTGIATGQYSYCRPREGCTEVIGPKNPFIVSNKEPGENPAYRFARLGRTLLRMAETIAGKRDWTRPGAFGMTGLEIGSFPVHDLQRTLQDPWSLVLGFREQWMNRDQLPSFDVMGEQIIKAVMDWDAFKQVHPLNILLSRLGFDGVSWADEALEYGDCGDYGCLLFPPITYTGEVVGLNPTQSIYMILP